MLGWLAGAAGSVPWWWVPSALLIAWTISCPRTSWGGSSIWLPELSKTRIATSGLYRTVEPVGMPAFASPQSLGAANELCGSLSGTIVIG